MHTNLTPNDAPGHRPGPPPPAPANRPRALLLILAVALTCLAALGPAQSALASEFNPKPVVNATQTCTGDPAKLVVALQLTNPGTAAASFHVDAAIGGIHQTDDFVVSPGAEEDPSYAGVEGQPIDVVVTSSDDAGLHFEVYAAHVDCLADPTASIAVECPATIGGQANVVYSYANPSSVPAYFEFMAPPSGGSSFGWDVSNQPTPLTTDYAVDEGTHVHVSVLADNVTIATLDQTVHCLPDPHHVVVSKKVVDSPGGNPAFDFRVECGKNGTIIGTIIDSFPLHDGESKSVAVPPGSQCVVNEASPPAGHYDVAHSLDGAPAEHTTGTFGFSSDADHTVAFTNTYRPDHHLTVTKHVVGGAPGQTFHFSADCLVEAVHEVTPFDLADGQSHALLFDGDTVSCTVTEDDPGKGWSTTHALDAQAPIGGRTETVTNDQADHTLAFVNTLPAGPSIPTTTVPSDTIPTPTVPGTIPETTTTSTTVPVTVPDPTTSSSSTSTTVLAPSVPATEVPSTMPPSDVPPSDVLAASIPTASPTPPALARTGSNLAPLALIGTLLVGSGALLLASLRRQRRRTA